MKPRCVLVGFIHINKHTHTPKLVATLKNLSALQFNKTEIIVSLKNPMKQDLYPFTFISKLQVIKHGWIPLPTQ